MVHGADTTTSRPPPMATSSDPGSPDYLADGYVPSEVANVPVPTSSTSPNSASVTLEYAADDFSVSQLAAALGHRSTVARFLERSQGWRRLLDPSTGHVAPKGRRRHLPRRLAHRQLRLTDTLAAATA